MCGQPRKRSGRLHYAQRAQEERASESRVQKVYPSEAKDAEKQDLVLEALRARQARILGEQSSAKVAEDAASASAHEDLQIAPHGGARTTRGAELGRGALAQGRGGRGRAGSRRVGVRRGARGVGGAAWGGVRAGALSRGSGGAQRCVRGRCFGHRRSRTRRRFGPHSTLGFTLVIAL